MSDGLNLNGIVNTTVTLSPQAAARRGYGELLIVGDSDVIIPTFPPREYTDLAGVAADFGTTAPEYQAAALYFGQRPRPDNLLVGRWCSQPEPAFLVGVEQGTLSLVGTLGNITNGSFDIEVNGQSQIVTGIDTSSASGFDIIPFVAAQITAELTGAVCRIVQTDVTTIFEIITTATGLQATIGYATAGPTSEPIHDLLGLSPSTGAQLVQGMGDESALAAVAKLADQSGAWYGLTMAATAPITEAGHIDIAAYIEAAAPARMYGITATDDRVLDPTMTTDIPSTLRDLAYRQTFVQYSQNRFAAASVFGRMASVDFNANRSTITLMFQPEPGVIPETLTTTQAATLRAKRCNVFVRYSNDTAILQHGVVSGPAFIDEVHGLDWLQNAIQTTVYNQLYTARTKVPQTEGGMTQIIAAVSSVCREAVANGLVAPGVWNAPGFGQLETGDYLDAGFYVWSRPMAEQAQDVREQRIAPVVQVAIKLAGAVQQIDVTVNVNR